MRIPLCTAYNFVIPDDMVWYLYKTSEGKFIAYKNKKKQPDPSLLYVGAHCHANDGVHIGGGVKLAISQGYPDSDADAGGHGHGHARMCGIVFSLFTDETLIHRSTIDMSLSRDEMDASASASACAPACVSFHPFTFVYEDTSVNVEDVFAFTS
jgi:hypothetical protein